MTTSARKSVLIGPNKRNSVSRVRAKVNDVKVLDLRLAGKTFVEIGNALGMSASGARKSLGRALMLVTQEIAEGADAYRALERERLEKVAAILWPGVEEGDLQTIDRYLKVRERIAKLLALDLRVDDGEGGQGNIVVVTGLPGVVLNGQVPGDWSGPPVIDGEAGGKVLRLPAPAGGDEAPDDPDDAETAAG